MPRTLGFAFCEANPQPIQERCLFLAHEVTCFVDRKPSSLVDLRDLDGAAGVWRPFYETGVADQVGRIAIALEGPRGDDLSALLLNGAELEKLSSGGEASLFLKLSLGRNEWLFVLIVLALRNRPGTLILLR